jgi:hypothetical protein
MATRKLRTMPVVDRSKNYNNQAIFRVIRQNWKLIINHKSVVMQKKPGEIYMFQFSFKEI